MRTATAIIIVLFIAAVILFGFIILRYTIFKPPSTTESEQTDITIEEESEPVTKEEATQEEPDQEKISTIEIYLDGDRDNGIFLGEAAYGMTSKEAFTFYGENFSDTGFLLVKEMEDYTFEPGSTHYIYIYTLIPEYGWDYVKKKVVVHGEEDFDESIKLSIEDPSSTIEEADKSNIKVSGWSVDLDYLDTTGIDKIEIYLNGPRRFGKSINEVNYGIERPDVANAFANANYVNSGYSFHFDGSKLEDGSENTLYFYSYSTSGTYLLTTVDFKIEGEKESNAEISVEDYNLNDQSIEISGWAINKDWILEGKPRSLDVEYSTKKILFTSNRTGNKDIFSMNLDGSELTQLTDYPGNDNYPAVSPDGKKIAYTSDINGVWQIMVMNWDGTDKTQITHKSFKSGYPTWSFDGIFIFFEVYQDGDWEIYRINSDGSNMERLTFNQGIYDWHPCCHPFQKKVIYESGNMGSEDLYFMDYYGKNKEIISSINARKRVPAISIDGKIIVFAIYEDDNSFIYTMDSNGENLINISGPLTKCCHPCISPDNAYIAFDNAAGGQEDLYITNPDGSNLTSLTNSPSIDKDPVFMYQVP